MSGLGGLAKRHNGVIGRRADSVVGAALALVAVPALMRPVPLLSLVTCPKYPPVLNHGHGEGRIRGKDKRKEGAREEEIP